MISIFFLNILLLLITSVKCDDDGGMGAGDAMALILGLTLGTLGILACLGKYARTVAAGRY